MPAEPRSRPRRSPAAAAALLALGGVLVFAPSPARAQGTGEPELRDRFEGTWVKVKLDMPAHQKGVDVWPGTRPPLDYPELAKRLKRYGISLRRGDEVQVTKVKVKKDLIEFQLGGGGYGTFGDDTDTDASVGSAPKTRREKNLEEDLKRETDAGRRRRIQEEIDSLRREREREDARNRAIAAEASEAKKEAVRSRAAEAGSRFNIRFEGPLPGSAATPDGVIAALGEYVTFDVHRDDHAGHDHGDEVDALPAGDGGVAALRKGMTRAQMEALLGPPASVTTAKEGTLRVEKLVFTTPDEKVDALLVEGVLVRYSVSSK
jgi:hypothetical protein